MSTLVGHFVLSPRERKKRGRRDSRGAGQGRKSNRNERKETEETRKSVHRTRMPPPKCHSEKGNICNCDRYSMKLLLRLISFL